MSDHGFIDADIVIDQLKEPPHNRWCASGHTAPELFRRSGPESLEEPTVFFFIQGNETNGIYCEPCLIIARHIASLNKKGLI